MANYLKTFYNEKTAPYTKYPFQLCEYLFKRFGMKQGDKILDVGSGRGDFSRGFKDLGLEVAGIDKEEGNKEMLKEVEFILKEIEIDYFPFKDATFDFIFSKSVIEHLWAPDNLMKEIWRVLKPARRIILMVPDWESQKNLFYDDFTHVHPYTKTALRDLLKTYNFKNLESEIFYQLPLLWKYPTLKIFSKLLQIPGPPKKIYKNKFVRWSRELMILATGIK